MELAIALTFIIGYAFIAGEHFTNINKTVPALLAGVLCWTLHIVGQPDKHEVTHHLLEHLGDIAGILFFLMGAMTIVELIDAHDGFDVITSRIRTNNKQKMFWILGTLTFFLSAVLDNLTTTIVIITLLRKLFHSPKERLTMAALTVIAANAGGAWSPIGDVTTTMLWIGGQISTTGIISQLFLPALVSLVVPMLLLAPSFRGTLSVKQEIAVVGHSLSSKEKLTVFCLGIGGLLFVPVFKTVTHLPPFMGMLFALGVIWALTEMMHKDRDEIEKSRFSVLHALRKMDMPSVLFFLGILLAVSALQTTGQLSSLANSLSNAIASETIIVVIIGLLSAIVDNVPLVAAAMGMYSLETYPMDHSFWELLAFCAGTGGSILIIGSAAGVAAMGLEKIEFFWYIRRISWLALAGYFAGVGMYLLQMAMFK